MDKLLTNPQEPDGPTHRTKLETRVASGSRSALIDQLHLDQRARWAAGDPVPLEQLLRNHAELLEDHESLLDLVYGEYLLSEASGKLPDLDHFFGRFPLVAAALQKQVALHVALETAEDLDGSFSDIRQSGTFADNICLLDWNQPPPSIPGYEIGAELGRGGMGIVYRARQISLGRDVALKLLHSLDHSQADRWRRFHTEAASIAKLRHPNFVQIHDYGVWDNCPYLVLELVEGGSLAEKISGVAQMPIRAAEWVETLAMAVQHAHEIGLIHRDLKPANVLMTSDGVLKITDLGIAKHVFPNDEDNASPVATGSGVLMGTPAYMAPEQITNTAGEVGPHTDVHALGVVLYQLLTGGTPYQAKNSFEMMQQIREHDPIAPRQLDPTVPRDLETICLKCLEKQPAKRYGSAAELAMDLRHFRAREPIAARRTGLVERGWRWCQRHPSVAALSLSLVCAISSGLIVVTALWIQADRLRNAAETNLGEARTNLRIAVEAVDKFCDKVTDDQRLLQYDLRPLRQQLLQMAVEFEQQLVLKQRNSTESRLDLAQAYKRLGRLSAEIDSLAESKQYFVTAQQLYEELITAQPQDAELLQDYAACCSDFATVLASTDGERQAESSLRKAVGLLDQIVEAAQSVQRDKANLLGQLSGLLRRYDRFDEADSLQRQSLEFFDHLHQIDPDNEVNNEDLVAALVQLGELYQYYDIKRWREAEQAYDRALTIQQSLPQIQPQHKHSDQRLMTMIRVYRNLGCLYDMSDRRDEAERAFQSGIEVNRELVLLHPSVTQYHAMLASLLDRLGIHFAAKKDFEAASTYWHEAGETWLRLTTLDPSNRDFVAYLGMAHVHQGELMTETGEIQSAVDSYSLGIDILDAALREFPGQKRTKDFLTAALERRATAYTSLQRFAEAAQDCDTAEQISEPLMRPWYHVQAAVARVRAGQYEEAVRNIQPLITNLDYQTTGQRRCLLECARVLAIAARQAGADAGQDGRHELGNRYADEALSILRRLVDEGGMIVSEFPQQQDFAALSLTENLPPQ